MVQHNIPRDNKGQDIDKKYDIRLGAMKDSIALEDEINKMNPEDRHEALTGYYLATQESVCRKLKEDPEYLLKYPEQVSQSLQMIFVACAVAANSKKISSVKYTMPTSIVDMLEGVDKRNGALLEVCGVEDKSEFAVTETENLRSAISDGKLPKEAAPILSLVIHESSEVVADIISDKSIKGIDFQTPMTFGENYSNYILDNAEEQSYSDDEYEKSKEA